MFACFFEANFPNIPFLKPRLLSFLAGSFSVVVFCLHGVRFCLSVSMLVLFLVLFLLCCFVLCLVLLSVYEQNTFKFNVFVLFLCCLIAI